MTGINPRRGRFSTETPLERQRRLEIQREQQRKRRQEETRGAERTSLSTAKATPSTRDRGEAAANTNMYRGIDKLLTITLQPKPMRRGNTDCRRFKKMPPTEFATKAMRRGKA